MNAEWTQAQRRLGMWVLLAGLLLVQIFMGLGHAGAAPLAQGQVPNTVGVGSVGAIRGVHAVIKSLPAGATLTPSPEGLLLPAGTVVELDGKEVTLTEPTPFVLTTGGVRPPTGLPSTGGGHPEFMLSLAGVALLLGGIALYTWGRRTPIGV